MNFGCQLLFLLVFLLVAAVFSSTDCIIPTTMQEKPKGRKLKFANVQLLLYCVLFCLMPVSIHKVRHNERRYFNSKHLRYSVNPKNGIILDMLENCRLSKFGDISDFNSKDFYASLFQFRLNTRQKCMVLPLSLEQYFQERHRNGNTADLMRYEWARYRTFSTFPTDSPARPIRLASNGFYYIGSGATDNVKCFSCELIYQGWKEGDVVQDVHTRHSPNCPFLTGVDKSNVGIHTSETQTATRRGNKEAASCHHTGDVYVQKQCRQSSDNDGTTSRRRQHKYPDFESYHYRMDTFTGWTCSEIIEPCVLADAGFFYAGFSDCVRCFSCGGGLRNWEYGDGPWEEHARWFPECLFILQQKGQGFIRQHKEAQAEPGSTDPGTSTACEDSNAKQLGKLDLVYAKAEVNAGGNETTVNTISHDTKCLKEENTRLKHQLTCKICMDKESNVVFIPCGHMVCCETCAPHIRKCAICRRLITGRVKAFMS